MAERPNGRKRTFSISGAAGFSGEKEGMVLRDEAITEEGGQLL